MKHAEQYRNYNVRVTNAGSAHQEWCDARGTAVKVFVSFDGGGYNHHVLEFQTLDDASTFMEFFGITRERSLWAEDTEGKMHYL